MFESIINAIKAAFRYIVNLVRKVIHGVLDFFREVVVWFKSLNLNPQEDTPFIADASEFKEMLKTAPKKNVGIFEGVYNEETDEITANRYLDADSLDAKTKEVLERDPLVVLS